MGQKKSEKRLKKEAYWRKLWTMSEKYEKCLIVECDNVSSKQIQMIRADLRKVGAEMIMGKNTCIKAALNYRNTEPTEEQEDYEERKDNWKAIPRIERLVNLFRGNVGAIFTNGDFNDCKQAIDNHKREAPARVGALAQADVWIRAGPTGLDPKQTGFFQNLQIQTKIVKTQIEIVNDKQILWKGEKVGGSEAALLEKLHICPFSYMMSIRHVFDNGSIFDPEVLDISEADILAKFQKGANTLAAACLTAGYPTELSVKHSVINAFKNLVSVTMESDFTFDQAEKVKAAAAAAPVAAAASTSAPEAKKEEAPKQEEEEEDDIDLAGGLFGDDY